METKICSKCGEEKNISDYRECKRRGKETIRGECLMCEKKYRIEYYYKNNTDIRAKARKFYKENKESELIRRKNHYNKNREKELLRMKIWRQENKEYFIEYDKKHRKTYENDKLKNNHMFRLSKNLRRRISLFLKTNNLSKKNTTFDIIGCTPEYLKEHIEKQFTEGMSWELIGKHIHIDHIIPLCSAKTEEEIYKLCHYSNLQPLWAKDNLLKGTKIQ